MNIDEAKELLKSNRWRVWGHWRQSVLANSLFLEAFDHEVLSFTGIEAPTAKAFIFKDDFFVTQEWFEETKKIIEATPDSFFLKYAERCSDYCKRVLSAKPPSMRSLPGFFEELKKLMGFTLVTHVADEVLEERIRKKIPHASLHVKPLKKTFLEQEKKDFLGIVQEYKRRQLPRDELVIKLEEHREKYGFLTTYFWRGALLNTDFYLERLKEELQKDESLEERQTKLEKEPLLRAIQELLFLKTYAIEVSILACFRCNPVLEEIAKKFGLRFEEVVMLSPNELRNALENSIVIPAERLRERIEWNAQIKIGSEILVFEGKALGALEEFVPLKKETARELKGTFTFEGKARGSAKVILDPSSQLGKIQRGDILVTSMTDPNFLPAFSKIAGIVTDMGGILCHAAIVSREYEIPCITNTKTATRVFKDGDLIELDPETKSVRKL